MRRFLSSYLFLFSVHCLLQSSVAAPSGNSPEYGSSSGWPSDWNQGQGSMGYLAYSPEPFNFGSEVEDPDVDFDALNRYWESQGQMEPNHATKMTNHPSYSTQAMHLEPTKEYHEQSSGHSLEHPYEEENDHSYGSDTPTDPQDQVERWQRKVGLTDSVNVYKILSTYWGSAARTTNVDSVQNLDLLLDKRPDLVPRILQNDPGTIQEVIQKIRGFKMSSWRRSDGKGSDQSQEQFMKWIVGRMNRMEKNFTHPNASASTYVGTLARHGKTPRWAPPNMDKASQEKIVLELSELWKVKKIATVRSKLYRLTQPVVFYFAPYLLSEDPKAVKFASDEMYRLLSLGASMREKELSAPHFIQAQQEIDRIIASRMEKGETNNRSKSQKQVRQQQQHRDKYLPWQADSTTPIHHSADLPAEWQQQLHSMQEQYVHPEMNPHFYPSSH